MARRKLASRVSLLATGVALAAAGGCSLSSVGGGTGGAMEPTGAGGRQRIVSGTGGAVLGSCPGATPETPLVDDFSAGGGGGIPHGSPYIFADPGLTVPVVDTSSGAMTVTIDTGPPTTMWGYVGFGVPFDRCFDLSGYVAVQFTISGTLSARCTMQFSLLDAVHDSSPPLGVCTGTCYPPTKTFTLPASPTPVTVFFTDPYGGGPVVPVVPSAALGVQWQIELVSGEAGGCIGELTIDDVYLVNSDPPP
jgi:hypothetical protein